MTKKRHLQLYGRVFVLSNMGMMTIETCAIYLASWCELLHLSYSDIAAHHTKYCLVRLKIGKNFPLIIMYINS